jgi:UDP-glucose 6-dehydrogenase
MNVSIIGYGWVGKFMKLQFPDACVYSKGEKEQIGTKEEANKADIAFVCVPTPCPNEGALDTSIVEEVVSWLECPLIVIRSTVNPGTCDYLSLKYGKHIVMQPEYLGETPAHPMSSPKERQFIVIGGQPEDRRKVIDLYAPVYNANIVIKEVTAYEAEVIKLSENRAISFKVLQCQELYDVCEKAGLNYYTIRDVVYGTDWRFNLWWTFVYPEKRGANSKCIPKDVNAWCAWAESLGYKPVITRALLERNKEWISQ